VSDVTGYVALGANLGNREANLRAGMSGMAAVGLGPTHRSSIWETEPVGTRGPRWFLNMVVRIRTSRSPIEVLEALLEIERRVGRTRSGVRNAPRVLDLDLLTLGDARVESTRLTLPHPRMWERRFVLAPLAEIAPGLRDPATGRTVQESLERLGDGHAARPLRGKNVAAVAEPAIIRVARPTGLEHPGT
jgi:2-amino-4-hydroxy-6-hydroxymethyldihydropteridine diphosphokinase